MRIPRTRAHDDVHPSVTFDAAKRDSKGQHRRLASTVTLLVLLLAASPELAHAGICNGLKAYWSCDEGTGFTIGDVAGAVNDNGTLTNGTAWATGISGNALSFDGSNDRVTVPVSADFASGPGLSISAWIFVLPNPPTTFQLTIASSNRFRLGWAQGNPFMEFQVGGGLLTIDSLPPYGTWAHVAATYDTTSGLAKFFVNGVEKVRGTICSTPCRTSAPTGTVYIGNSSLLLTPFQGLIDEVYIHNRALTDAEIHVLAMGPALTDRLAGAWCFDEGAGLTSADHAGAIGDDVTLVQGAGWGSGLSESSLAVDGPLDAATAPTSTDLDLATAVSVSAWVNFDAVGSGPEVIVDKSSGANGYYLRWNPATGLIEFQGRGALTANVVPTRGMWAHVCGTYDGSTGQSIIYVDGVPRASGVTCGSPPCAPLTSAATFSMGADAGVHTSFGGRIDEVRVFNRALSFSEVQVLAGEVPGNGVPGPTAKDVSMPGSDAGYDLVGDVDVTPRMIPGFDTRAVLMTRDHLLVLNTVTEAVESSLPLIGQPVRGIDPVFSADGSRMAIVTTAETRIYDTSMMPPVLLSQWNHGGDPPVTDQDPFFKGSPPTLLCIVPFANSVKVFNVSTGAAPLILARSSVGIDAVDPVLVGSILVVPNTGTVDFFNVITGALTGTVGLQHPALREVDLVYVEGPEVVYWPLDGAVYRLNPATHSIQSIITIPGSSVEGCDMVVDRTAPGIGMLGIFANSGFVHFFNLFNFALLQSVPTPGTVVRNFDPLITPWSLVAGSFGPTVYWSVEGTTYAVDRTQPNPVATINTPGGLVDGVDLTASNDMRYAVLPHPGFVHVLDLKTASLVGPLDGTIQTPGTLRVDVDPVFPTTPLDTTRSSRIMVPYRGGLLALSRYAGLPTQCVLPTIDRVYWLDLAAMSVAGSRGVPALAAGCDPVLTQGVRSPYDDDPYLGRDRDQDFLCNRAQMEPFVLNNWFLPFWPMRIPWWPGGPGRIQIFDSWGGAKLELLADRRKVAVIDQFDGTVLKVLTLPDTVVGGFTYDRDWRRARVRLDNGSIANIDMTPVQASGSHRPDPTFTVTPSPGMIHWPPANDAWGGHDVLVGDFGTSLRLMSYSSGSLWNWPLPAPPLFPPAIDYKNSSAVVIMPNFQRCAWNLYPAGRLIQPDAICNQFFFGGRFWRPIANTVFDEMNHLALNLVHQRQLNEFAISVFSEGSGAFMWHFPLPFPPIGNISIENKSELAKVPLANGNETIINFAPIAWGGPPVVNTRVVVDTWARPPVWAFQQRWEVNQQFPVRLNIIDANRNAVIDSVDSPGSMTGSVIIDPIHQYFRVRVQSSQSLFVDLFKLGQGLSQAQYTRIDTYSGALLQDAVFDPVGGYDLAVVGNGSSAQIVITRSRSGVIHSTVPLPAQPARPISFDPFNRTAEIILPSGATYLLDLSHVHDSGGLPVLRPVSLPIPPLSATDLVSPPSPNLASVVAYTAGTSDGVVELRAPAGTVEPHAFVAVVNQTQTYVMPNELQADSVGGFSAQIMADTADVVCVVAADVAGNAGTPDCMAIYPVPALDVGPRPKSWVTRIESVQPNPFSRSVDVQFSLATASSVRLEVFDAAGRRVRTIEDGGLPPGPHIRSWNGVDRNGRRVNAGTYFIRLTAGGFRFVRPVTFVK